ncbi:MAG: hypothetical protein ACP5QT_05425, partial [Brevinematia bacterium]
IPLTNSEAKPYEAANIFFEILAGGGILGTMLFVGFVVSLFFTIRKALKIASSSQKFIIYAATCGLILQWILLSFNQNILRIYVWNHIAFLGIVLAPFYFKERKEVKNQINIDFNNIFRILNSFFISILLFLVVTLLYIFQPIDIKIKKIELNLGDSTFTGFTKLNLFTGRKPYPWSNFENIDAIYKSTERSSRVVFDFSEYSTNFLFTEYETSQTYDFIANYMLKMNLEPRLYHYNTNFIFLLKKYNIDSSSSPQEVIGALNEILKNENLYRPDLINNVLYSELTEKYLKMKNLTPSDRIKLNRLLMEDVFLDINFPISIPRNPVFHNILDMNIVFTNSMPVSENQLELKSIIFYTDKGKIELSSKMIFNFFSFYPCQPKISGDRIKIPSFNNQFKLSFTNYPLCLFLRYVKYRNLYFILAVLAGISGFMVSLFLQKNGIPFSTEERDTARLSH